MNIHLIPPNIIVSQVASVYGIAATVKEGGVSFGYVRQTYADVASVYAGQRILYRTLPENPLLTIEAQPFSLINENQIFLVEPPTELS